MSADQHLRGSAEYRRYRLLLAVLVLVVLLIAGIWLAGLVDPLWRLVRTVSHALQAWWHSLLPT